MTKQSEGASAGIKSYVGGSIGTSSGQGKPPRVTKAVIPAAGLGTRFLPATKAQPKEMLPIIDKPTIQFIVEEAVRSGIKDILIITGRGKRAIEDHFDRSIELEDFFAARGKSDMLQLVQEISDLADIHFIRQKEALGLGHAVLCARRHIGSEPFAVLLGDEIYESNPPCLAQLLDIYAETGHPVIGVTKVARQEVSRYGIIKPGARRDRDHQVWGEGGRVWQVHDLVEKPTVFEAPSDLAVIGRYILKPDIFDILAKLPPGVGGEIQLTDALRILNQQEQIVAWEFAGRRYDIGDTLGYVEATVEFALRRPELRGPLREYLIQALQASEQAGTTAEVAAAAGGLKHD